MHDVRDNWMSQSYNALKYQQEHFKNAAQEHQSVAYEQVEIAAALATNRTAAQMTGTENNVEANFVLQQQILLSEITSESAQELETQRDHLFQEAAAEMMRSDSRNLEMANIIIIMLKVNPMNFENLKQS